MRVGPRKLICCIRSWPHLLVELQEIGTERMVDSFVLFLACRLVVVVEIKNRCIHFSHGFVLVCVVPCIFSSPLG